MKYLYLLIPYLLSFSAFSQVFVRQGASGSNDGTSWENAYTDLTLALKEAPYGSEIWVAQGTYVPHNGISRDSSFTPKSGMKLLGGFSGTETAASQRNHELYKTIISGQTGSADTSGNVNILINILNQSDTITVDGFVLTRATNNRNNTSTINLRHCKLKLRNCDIVENYTSRTGAGAGGVKGDSCFAEIDNCKFRDNIASGQRSLYFYNANLIVKNSTFTNNSFVNYANYMAYVSNPKESIIFENCTFSGNPKGELQLYGKNVLIKNCRFSGNSASSYMIYSNSDSMVVEGCSFENNTVESSGYLLYYSHGIFRNSSFLNNKASGFYCMGDSTRIISCNIQNNGAPGYTSGFVYTRFLDIIDTDFINNHSGGSNYTMYAYDSCNFVNSRFIGNGKPGITNTAGVAYYGRLNIDQCLFKDNFAQTGGALYGGAATIRNSTFDGNKATSSSAAIYCFDSLYLENSLFTNNSLDTSTNEQYNGGGVFMVFDGITAVNCAFTNNSAETGAVVYNPFSGANSLYANCTFFNNFSSSDSARGIIHDGGNVRIRNSILWNKNKEFAYPDSMDVQYSIVKGGMAGTGNISTDPGLGLLFRLKEGSPAIDAGAPDAAISWPVPAYDLNGDTRTVNNRLDIGATEYQETVEKNLVTGKVFGDKDNSCSATSGDSLLPGMLLIAEPGSHYATTDSSGSFAFLLPPGNYEIASVIPSKKLIRQDCQNNTLTISLPGSSQTIDTLEFFFYLIPQPDMRVHVSQSAKRPCMKGSTTISYWNDGNVSAEDVTLSLIYPSELIPQDLPGHVKTDSLYLFNLGDVSTGERRSFVIQDSVSCLVPDLLGNSVCVEASVAPFLPTTAGTEWDGSDIEITGICRQDTIHFEITNTGTGDMGGSSTYRIFFNDVLVKEDGFILPAASSLRLAVPSLDQVIRLEADQRPGYPEESQPRLTVENCGEVPEDSMITFGASVDVDDMPVFRDINCAILTGAYDPNDKKAEPFGKYEEHYIPAYQNLEYTINFQNTGNDTAFTVVLIDTLSQMLDVSTIKVLSASHPFSWEVSGEGNPVLSFTFNNILLPDSNRNEPGSHGQIVFSVSPIAGTPEGSVIENEAYIFFDYNPPIQTNKVFHTIGDPVYTNFDLGMDIFPQVVTANKPQATANPVKAFPNPVTTSGQLNIFAGRIGEQKTVLLTDLTGRNVAKLSTTGENITLTAPDNAGIYFYSILFEDGERISGKICVEKQ